MSLQHLYAHGKLMITGEYSVLDGAKSLAIPTKAGQHFRAKTLSSDANLLYWVALNAKNEIWLNLIFDKSNFECLNSESKEAFLLTTILQQIRKQQKDFLTEKNDTAVETALEFPNEWGLGSSATLIANIARWSGVSAYHLLQDTIGGSGYDVYCAVNDNPIFFQKNKDAITVNQAMFHPVFSDKVYFVYTGKKQLSSAGIQLYKNKIFDKQKLAVAISTLTDKIATCTTLADFEQYIMQHEALISDALGLPKVKDSLLPELDGCAKSLGAWGGDFVLLTTRSSRKALHDYLHTKNIHTLFSYDEMIFKK